MCAALTQKLSCPPPPVSYELSEALSRARSGVAIGSAFGATAETRNDRGYRPLNTSAYLRQALPRYKDRGVGNKKANDIIGYNEGTDVFEMICRITAAYAEMYLRNPSRAMTRRETLHGRGFPRARKVLGRP
jgi:hypothetical protein